MANLKKLSKNNTFNFIVIYGPVAAGKFTVANELQKLTNYKFFHNHHIHDLARQLFERNTLGLHRLREKIMENVLCEIAEARLNVITTHAYANDFVSLTGLSDPAYLKKIKKYIESRGGKAYFVHLLAEEKELLKRVTGPSRKKFGKLRDAKLLKEHLAIRRWKIPASIKDGIQIDNSKLSPREVARIIAKHFKLTR